MNFTLALTRDFPIDQWREAKGSFFNRAGLPANPSQIEPYLKERLNRAYDQFLEKLPHNTFANIDEDGWHLFSDPTEKLDSESGEKLQRLKNWLSGNMKVVKFFMWGSIHG